MNRLAMRKSQQQIQELQGQTDTRGSELSTGEAKRRDFSPLVTTKHTLLPNTAALRLIHVENELEFTHMKYFGKTT